MIGGINNIQIFGPKGTGKTCALLRLEESLPDTCYIDLADYSETVDFDNKFLLIDNAQLFTADIRCQAIRSKKVIAAFSPGAKLTVGKRILSKRCGDGNDIFFCWRPFTYNEVKCLVSNLGFTVASKTNFEQKQISEQRLKLVFCKTNGNPRYITRYFQDEHLHYMLTTLDDQYKNILKIDGVGGPYKICRSLVALLKSGECQLWDTPSVIGCAYCTNPTSIGKWKLAHAFYGFRAVEDLGGCAFHWGERWQQLESITQLMLSTSDVKVFGRDSELTMKKAEKIIQQNEIGEKPVIEDNSVTLLVLAPKHNVIDSILYDCRRKPSKVYFVQTSSSAYSSKKKGMECLQDPVKKDSTDMSEGKPIIDHYTDFLSGEVEKYYIYATTDCSRSTKNRNDVYFLDLLELCPDSSSNYIIETDDSGSD